MARLPRVFQKIFAKDAGNNGVFGSGQAGSKILSDDITTLQSLPAYLTGWLNAVIGTRKFPPLEEFQSLNYINTYQLAYLFQQGIPEWNALTTYYQNSIVCKTGTYQIYGSKIDDNIGNALPDGVDDANWKYLQDLSQSTVPNATTSIRGIAMLAVLADVLAANTDKIVTPDLLLRQGVQPGMGIEWWLSSLPSSGGWIWADGKSIGNASSNGTNRANADTEALFTALWNDAAYNYTGATATLPALQVYNSSGVAVAKGVSAAADYAANRSIKVIDKRGLVSAGKDNMGGTAAGRLTGQALGINGQILGAIGGQEGHTLVVGELAEHTHGLGTFAIDTAGTHTHDLVTGRGSGPIPLPTDGGTPGTGNPYATTSAGAHTHNISGSLEDTGGDESHNNVQPTTICNYLLKL